MKEKFKGKGGKISIGTLIWLVLIISVLYFGAKFIPPYLNYYLFKGAIEAEAETAYLHYDQDIIRSIMQNVKLSELPIEEKDVLLNRRDNDIEISIKYNVTVNFFNRYTKTILFNIDVVKPIKAKQ